MQVVFSLCGKRTVYTDVYKNIVEMLWWEKILTGNKIRKRGNKDGTSCWWCDQNEKTASMWRKSLEAGAGWYGHKNGMYGMRTSCYVAAKAGRKGLSKLSWKKRWKKLKKIEKKCWHFEPSIIYSYLRHGNDLKLFGVWHSLASVPDLGSGGRRFESCHPDCDASYKFNIGKLILGFPIYAGVVQW